MLTPRFILTIGFFALLAAILWLLLHHCLFATGAAGITAQIAAVIFMLWTRWTFDTRSFHLAADPTKGALVTHGPYGIVRHPIYASILLFTVAGVATHLSPLNLLAGSVAIAGVTMRVLSEEKLLRERYVEYDAYSTHTKRLVPFVF